MHMTTLWRKLTTDRLGLVLRGISFLVLNMEKLMTVADDMKASVDALKSSNAKLHDEITVVTDLVKTLAANHPDPAVQEAVNVALAGLAEAKDQSDQDNAALQAAVEAASASGSAPNT